MQERYMNVCSNGHWLETERPLNDFCEKCGSKMMSRCQNCNEYIKHIAFDDDMIILNAFSDDEKPSYCRHCSKPFPWITAALEAAELLITEDENLETEEQEQLISTLPDIISETPRTQLATVRIKKLLLKAGKFTAEGIRQFAIDFACELAKQLLLGTAPAP